MAVVNEIEQVRGHRVRITLDDGSRFVLLKSAFQERPLETGQELDAAEYADWVLKKQYRSALDKAVAMLAVRACSRGEISQKLRGIGYSPETIEMVLYKLESNDLLNDREFARQWADHRASRKYGPRRIQQELRAKGVSAEETEEALQDISEEDQLENALALARKSLKHAPGEDARKVRQRAMGAIVRRGYSWDLARQAVDTVSEEMGIDEEQMD